MDNYCVSERAGESFIQIRQELPSRLPSDAKGIALRVRGNGATYYVHMRPDASRRPWPFYQAAFKTTENWQEITLPCSAFIPQGGLAARFVPQDIRSIGLVAYGADYEAALDVDWIATVQPE